MVWSTMLDGPFFFFFEALAAARALEFAAELGINHAVLEGDSLMLIQALKNGCVDLFPCGLLLDDV